MWDDEPVLINGGIHTWVDVDAYTVRCTNCVRRTVPCPLNMGFSSRRVGEPQQQIICCKYSNSRREEGEKQMNAHQRRQHRHHQDPNAEYNGPMFRWRTKPAAPHGSQGFSCRCIVGILLRLNGAHILSISAHNLDGCSVKGSDESAITAAPHPTGLDVLITHHLFSLSAL